MFKSYFILNRLANEFNQKLTGFYVTRAFSFEKEKLALILNKGDEELSLELSVNPQLPYITLKRKVSIPKKNLIDFFSAFLPAKLESIGISERDRIIKFLFDKASIYFTIRGKNTNVFLIPFDGEIESFKKSSEEVKEDFKNEVSKTSFISGFNNIEIKDTFIDAIQLRKEYPFIGKEIINEAKLCGEEISDKLTTGTLTKVIESVRSEKPVVFIDEDSNEINLGVESSKIFSFTKKEIFPNVISALDYFLIKKYSLAGVSNKKKIIEKHLERELQKTTNKLNDVNLKIQRGSKEEEYNRIANILLVNIDKLHKGSDKIELTNIYNTNEIIIIMLDPKHAPKQNVEMYFEKAKNERLSLVKATQLEEETKKRLSALQKTKEKLIKAETTDDYYSIMKELKINDDVKKKPDNDIKNKFRHYLVEKKYHVFVGKDSKTNDLLTLKFAKQNDYWFHARSVSGSHVVLRNENHKEGIPKNILKLVASIAAYHSKAKTAGMVPVSYTQKKYVVKKKGMEPGKVALLKEEVLIVEPEINKKCEYITD